MECAICNKPLNRFYAVRIGGIIEQVTGKQFICRECMKLARDGAIDMRVLAKEVNHGE